MDSLDTQIETILNGQPLSQDIPIVCDFNDSINKSELETIVQKNVYYNVTAVIFNDNMDVLMIQEAHRKCRGQWSLPTGMVDPNEQIIDAIRREVREESGLEMEPTDLVMIENSNAFMYLVCNFRFIFSGRVIGGQLKSVEDSESIQAKWWSESDMSSLNLRYDDILDVISVVRNHNTSVATIPYHISRFTVSGEHNKMLLRVVFTVRRNQNKRQYVLISKLPFPHLPKRLFKTYIVGTLLGVLSVEHNGVPRNPLDLPHDGLCITVLVKSRVPYEGMGRICSDYEWMQMSPSLEALLARCLDNPNTELIQWRPKFWNKKLLKNEKNMSSHSNNMDKLSTQLTAM
ncbi:unnamed protein product [Oppiella nova]|uniref:Nudix hydrolase domain-containing protein n=1 Tax=Oppiella nova TaxID=334625 RepID=A0A7R9QKA1_9ACAR|nr:unnamed protein product [Oppiella nova]CAG2167529.1 unnamed protein product [Oppiella nova]